MKQLKVRFGRPEDAAQIVNWLAGNSGNSFDPDILKYPTLRTLCAYNGSPVAYLPSQQALVLESYAPKPGLSEEESALALRDLVKGMELLASSLNIREIYFLDGDNGVAGMAVRHGFEELPMKIYRLKLQ